MLSVSQPFHSQILPKRYAMLESHQKNSLLSMYETRMAEVKGSFVCSEVDHMRANSAHIHEALILTRYAPQRS